LTTMRPPASITASLHAIGGVSRNQRFCIALASIPIPFPPPSAGSAL
jgi:hypothetical protein